MDRLQDYRRRHVMRKKNVRSGGAASRNYHDIKRGPNLPHLETGRRHPLVRPQSILFKCLAGITIVLATAVIYKQQDMPVLKKYVSSTLTEDANFSKVSAWYSSAFGEPLDIWPKGATEGKTSKSVSTERAAAETLAVPVNGEVTEGFSKTKKGIIVKTGSNADVEAVNNGFVVSVETDEATGKTIVIKHNDGYQTWYGELSEVDVKPYDFVKKGQKIGSVAKGENQADSEFYFAIKDSGHFIDPLQVISFD